MFQTINVENFRGFGKLHLEGVGRVNLIVGKNNTGKTSFLEAITLLTNPSQLRVLPGLFRANAGFVGERFYRWLLKDRAVSGVASLFAESEELEARRVILTPTRPLDLSDVRLVAENEVFSAWCNKQLTELLVHAVSVQHGSPGSMIDAFAEAVRSPVDERQMEALLASVDPRIKSIRLDAVQEKPFIVVDIGLSARVPLSQIGQGIYRLVAIFSELLGNKPKVCVIDEIENGIHYSALPEVWTGLSEVAERLGVQIFATTHSWECLVAAHEAFAARKAYDLRVIQLYRLAEGTSGRVLDREHIEAAIAGTIEVR